MFAIAWLLPLLLLATGGSPAAKPVRVRASTYHQVAQATLGGEGGWDYLTVDPVARRIYIARSTHVMVVDADSLKVVGDIPMTPGVHGVALVPALGRGYTSNGRDSSVTVFDLATLEELRRIRVNPRPDAIVFDPASKCVFTLDASGTATAIDAATDSVVGTVRFGTKPEAAVCDGHGRMFVNLEDSSQVAVVDTRTREVIARWPLATGENPTGIDLDASHGRLFSVCGNKKMVVLDTATGKVVATLPIGSRVDGVVFDPERGFAFSSNGDGTLTVVRELSPARFEVVANIPTAVGARTLALDPSTHCVYVVTARLGPPPPATTENPHPRPPMVPGTFEVRAYGE